MSSYVKKMVREAKKAGFSLAQLGTKEKNKALLNMAKALLKEKGPILRANAKDLKAAGRSKLKESFVERLTLTNKRIEEMSLSLREVAALNDPVGRIISKKKLDNGIELEKVRVPIGVVLIVYEARPNVTSDCAGLLFKTSNVGILRGGGSAGNSNLAIGEILLKAARNSGINFDPFFIVDKTSHAVVDELLKQNESIDLVIPRGGEALIRKVVAASAIPVIKHYKGVCHIFVDKSADLKEAVAICLNAKTQRPSVCNAVETILVHEDQARRFLPLLKKAFDDCHVVMRGDAKARKIISKMQAAKALDWGKEYLDLIVAVKVVKDVSQAIEHINKFGSHHTESILSRNKANIKRFLRQVDSACCFANISTRFSDGFQFGLGAEIGISTDKLHARGPMGLEELTTYKWIATGSGQIRQ
jgi:glutamate-5-semialdehyde dehydrogenase